MPPVYPGAGPVVPPPMGGAGPFMGRAGIAGNPPLDREQVTGAGRLLQVLTRDLFRFDPREGKRDWQLATAMLLMVLMLGATVAPLMSHPLGFFILTDELQALLDTFINSCLYGMGMLCSYSVGRNKMSTSVLRRLGKMADTIARPAVQALQRAGIRLPPLPRDGRPVPGIPLPDEADRVRAQAMELDQRMAPHRAPEVEEMREALRVPRRPGVANPRRGWEPKPRMVVKDGRLIRETKKEAKERAKKDQAPVAEDENFLRAIGAAGILPIGGAALGGLVPPGAAPRPATRQGLEAMQRAQAGQAQQQARLAQQQLAGMTPQQFADRQRQRDALDAARRDGDRGVETPADPAEDEQGNNPDMVEGP